MLISRYMVVVSCAVLQCAMNVSANADEPALHQQIDELIAAKADDYESRASELTSDATFLRRVFLDLAGRIPSAQEARDFIHNPAAGKRVEVIDGLLHSPQHCRHLQQVLDVMLMHRLPAKNVPVADWQAYLFDSIRDNKPWDVLVGEMLAADGADAATRARSRFLLDRELKTEETTRDLGRVFLGRDLQCAQCHDHPTIGDYAQQHYFGLSAFLNRSYLFTDPGTKQKSIGEKAVGTVRFTSVFTNLEAETPPQMLDLPPFKDPPADSDAYVAKPEKTTRGIPRYSRRQLLAKAMTDPANRDFSLNIANRLWALMMGRGLVEPLDMFHSDNPPTHPKLLNLLADDLVAHKYDMRRTLRQIAMSQTYQRSSRLNQATAAESERYGAGLLKPLSPEQLAWSVMQACGVVDTAQRSAAAELHKADPEATTDVVVDAFQQESLVNKALTPHVSVFVTEFASANESSRFDATASQALFILNGDLIGGWLQPADDNLTARLLACEDDDQLADELFFNLLTRSAAEREVAAVKQLLAGDPMNREAVLKQAIRSILCSAEFRFNH